MAEQTIDNKPHIYLSQIAPSQSGTESISPKPNARRTILQDNSFTFKYLIRQFHFGTPRVLKQDSSEHLERNLASMGRTTELESLRRPDGTPHEPITQTIQHIGNRGQNLAEVAHDARNMVAALACYCDLLEEPGVLSEPYRHYGHELKLVADASRRLIDKLLRIEASGAPVMHAEIASSTSTGFSLLKPALEFAPAAKTHVAPPSRLVDDFAWELQKNRNLLAALAGPSISLSVDITSGESPIHMTCDDLTRILVNLVKNAAEAMPVGGTVQISLREIPGGPGENAYAILTVEDNGPGIATSALKMIFNPGYTTRAIESDAYGVYKPEHHGLGLSITRSIVQAAGGRIHAANRDPSGACFQIELPVRTA